MALAARSVSTGVGGQDLSAPFELPVTLPATVVAGDILHVSVGIQYPETGTRTLTTPEGWTLLYHKEHRATPEAAHIVLAKVADGTEDGGTLTLVFGASIFKASYVCASLHDDGGLELIFNATREAVDEDGATTTANNTYDVPALVLASAVDGLVASMVNYGSYDGGETAAVPTGFALVGEQVATGGGNDPHTAVFIDSPGSASYAGQSGIDTSSGIDPNGSVTTHLLGVEMLSLAAGGVSGYLSTVM
jgi:hypothetical protein